MVKKTKKQLKKRNKIISLVLVGLTAYILIVNNSLEFLKGIGILVEPNVIQLIMIFITLIWLFWKAGAKEL